MFAALLLSLATQSAATPDPFATLREAYARRDAALAASAYADDADVIYRYDRAPDARYRGSAAIRASFARLFGSFDPTEPPDLNFRIAERVGDKVSGFYRLSVGRNTRAYGRFAATVAPDGRFTFDESRSATRDDFEEAAGPVRFAADTEDLDRGYYAAMAGRYRLSDGCFLVVTRSLTRLFVRNSCTQQWRGLTRVSGREWTAGRRVIDAAIASRYRFAPIVDGSSPSLSITDSSGTTVNAVRADSYQTEDVAFVSADGTRLVGTLYRPITSSERPAATVMIHGSGPQDRDGYASIIAVMADALAAEGRAVLAYDKRGSGGSSGDGNRAGFDVLAADAIAAMQFLRSRADLDPGRIGLAGSSQAGWVAARAIELGARPSDVLLLGAAGSAMTVREQNLYNTEVQMRCAGVAAPDRRLALAQQAAFFGFLARPSTAGTLDSLTARAQAAPALAAWIFPASRSVNRTDNSWFNVLATDYDPLPVWRRFEGRTMLLFGTLDDATPTMHAVRRLRSSNATVRVMAGAQHLGLSAATVCQAGLQNVAQFHPELFSMVRAFARDN
jgi:alpha/beta superfamily hydrolase/ketosteroid isomerase-like protein